MSDYLRKHEFEESPPWPYVRDVLAAKVLDVTVGRIHKLANNPIPAVRVRTKSGRTGWVFQKSAINEIAARMGRDPLPERPMKQTNSNNLDVLAIKFLQGGETE